MILNASLDTSFWNRACEIGVTVYLFSYFKVYSCAEVRKEIITTDPLNTPLIYPQAMQFKVYEEDGRLHQQEPKSSLHRFGAGEASAMSLALEHQWILLINDSRPLVFAQTLGVTCISVPEFCVFLFAKGKITYAAVDGYLNRLLSTTSHTLITQAAQTLAVMIERRGQV